MLAHLEGVRSMGIVSREASVVQRSGSISVKR
jgi:hypothetical protein